MAVTKSIAVPLHMHRACPRRPNDQRFLSGQSLDSPYPQGIDAQTRQVMRNLTTVLGGCGLGIEHVVQFRIYLTQFARDYEAMNAAYASHFAPERRLARTCIEVTDLARGALVEIDLVSCRPSVKIARKPCRA